MPRVSSNSETERTTDEVAVPPRKVAGWARALLAASVVFMIVGLTMMAYVSIRSSSAASDTLAADGGAAPGLARGFIAEGESDPDGGDSAAEEPPDALDRWSPTIFRLGFSFFVGFTVAYAVRSFMKIALIVIGVLFLALFGLQYAGVIDVDWATMGEHFDALRDRIAAEASSFGDFITGALPSAGAAVLGLVAGFRRK
jgi:uncharacterized membrane protein (Fun14 family)